MTIMRVHSVICVRSFVSESCVIVGLNPIRATISARSGALNTPRLFGGRHRLPI